MPFLTGKKDENGMVDLGRCFWPLCPENFNTNPVGQACDSWRPQLVVSALVEVVSSSQVELLDGLDGARGAQKQNKNKQLSS